MYKEVEVEKKPVLLIALCDNSDVSKGGLLVNIDKYMVDTLDVDVYELELVESGPDEELKIMEIERSFNKKFKGDGIVYYCLVQGFGDILDSVICDDLSDIL